MNRPILKSLLFLRGTALLLFAILSIISCKKYYNPPSVFEDYATDSTDYRTRKVLFISIDGLSGEDFKTAAPTTMTSLLQNSKYSYAQYNEDKETVASAWTSMMTGMNESTHGVYDSSLAVVNDADADFEDEVTIYPTFMNKILLNKPALTVAAVTPWSALNSVLFRSFRKKVAVANDQSAKDSMMSILQTEDYAVNILHLNGVALAGQTGGYSLTGNAAYKAAIDSADAYVKQVIETVKSRTAYSNENWLIIINSDHGNLSSSDKAEQKGFVLYYNSNLSSREVALNGSANAQFTTRNLSAPYIAYTDSFDNDKFAFGKTKEFTIEYTVKLSDVKSYAFFLNVRNGHRTTNQKGFGWISSGGTWQIQTASGSSGAAATVYQSGKTINDGNWHTLTMVVRRPSSSQTSITGYYDGDSVSTTTRAATDFGTFSPSASVPDSFRVYMGISPSMWASTSTRGCIQTSGKLKIWDKALNATEVADNVCLQDITQHPEYSHLIGYWPCDEYTGTTFYSGLPNGNNMTWQMTGNWVGQSEAPCNQPQPDASNPYSIMPMHADIAANILCWLKINNSSDNSWGWNGSQWLSDFETEYAQ